MSRRDNQRRGGLVGLLGSGVGLAAEYHEHRKQKKLSRENSQQNINDDAGVGSSTNPPPTTREITPNDAPPAYTDAVQGGGDRSLASGAPVSTDKKTHQKGEDSSSPSSSDDDMSIEGDEEDWQLDEAMEKSRSQSPPGYEESESEYRTTDDLVRDVMQTTAISTIPKIRQPLQAPVILPQRRPRNKKRGFVRAYAPALADSGIDQETFLKFLKNFQASSKASPVFDVVIVSATIAGFAPSVIAMAVTTAVTVAAKTGQTIQERQRANNFLDRMNEELFKPAGLYCMIMKYTPEADIKNSNSMLSRFGIQTERVNLSTNESIAKYTRTMSGESSERTMKDRMKNMRLASGSTKGAFELPAASPLIFPDLDHAIVANGAEETFKDKAKDAQKFMAGYLDRRAQMQYATNDPNSQLALPEEQRKMKAKLADPNHAMFQGGLVGFVSGGAIDRRPRREQRNYDRGDRHYERDERRVLKYEQRMEHGRGLSRKQERRYDRFVDESEHRQGFMDSRMGGGERRRRGPIGALIGVATTAYQKSQESSSSRSNAPAPHGVSNPPAPYGGSDRSASHGGSNPPAPYGGSQQRYEEDEYDDHARSPAERGYYGAGRRPQQNQQKGGPLGMVKRMMQEDMLYLMVVNMPSEAELAEARATMGAM